MKTTYKTSPPTAWFQTNLSLSSFVKKIYLFFIFSIYTFLLLGQDRIPYKVGDLYGYAKFDGELIIDPVFSEAKLFDHHGRAIVTYEDKQMLIDSLGNLITNISGLKNKDGRFDKIYAAYGKYYLFKQGDYAGMLDSTLKVLCLQKALSVSPLPGFQHILVRQRTAAGLAIGLVDLHGKFVFPMEIGTIGSYYFEETKKNEIFYRKQNGKYKLYDEQQQPILDTIYDKVNIRFLKSDGIILCYNGAELDVYNQAFEPLFSDFDLESFRSVTALQKYVDLKKIDKATFAKIFDATRDVRCWNTEKESILICVDNRDKSKRSRMFVDGVRLLGEDEEYMNFKPDLNLLYYRKGEDWAVKNIKNEVLIPLGIDRPVSTSGIKRILLRRETDYQFVALDGTFLTKLNYKYANSYSIKSKENLKHAYHRGDGVPLTAFKYDTIIRAKNFVSFFAKEGSQYVLLDSFGIAKKNLDFDQITRMGISDFYKVRKGEQQGVISNEGVQILATKYSEITKFDKYSSRLFRVTEGGQEKLVNLQGQVLAVDPKEINGRGIMRLIEDCVMLKYKDGTNAFFSATGEKTIHLEREGSLMMSVNESKLGVFTKGGYYFNYTTGKRYKE